MHTHLQKPAHSVRRTGRSFVLPNAFLSLEKLFGPDSQSKSSHLASKLDDSPPCSGICDAHKHAFHQGSASESLHHLLASIKHAIRWNCHLIWRILKLPAIMETSVVSFKMARENYGSFSESVALESSRSCVCNDCRRSRASDDCCSLASDSARCSTTCASSHRRKWKSCCA